ncbi:MAG TPA: M20/M25/M40 family metallo-hydrolase, partial [Bacillota bacterium]|nr:M20/M25/M40 family metallo-hydrolase [Bacillota bacterium]
MSDAVLTYLTDHQAAMLDDARTLVSLDSPSLEPALVNRCVDVVAGWAGGLGAQVRRLHDDGIADRLVAVWPAARGSGARRALLMVHVDTVWPADETTRRPFRVEDGKAYGPGVYDMKGGVVQG